LTAGGPGFLVTGGSGFLGRHVLFTLRRLEPDARLLVLVRDAAAWRAQEWAAELGPVELLEGPLTPTDAWRADPRLAGVRGIFHLAAVVNHSRSALDETFRTNVTGTTAMVELAAYLGCRLLFVSTSGVVSCSRRPGDGAFEDGEFRDDVVGAWPYYASKIAAEREARTLADRLGVELVVVRPPVLLGPGDHRFRSTVNVLRVMRGRVPAVPRGGMHFADVRDAADAIVRAMLLPRPRSIYHLVGAVSSLDAFFCRVAEAAGLRRTWRVLPSWLMLAAARLNRLLGSPLHVLPDPVLLEMASHHWDHRSRFAEPELTYASRAPDETLRDTVDWLREHHPELRPATCDRLAPNCADRRHPGTASRS
jgi:nucleoside-diphosphate-sugar epimerase